MIGLVDGSTEVNIASHEAIWLDAPKSRTRIDDEEEIRTSTWPVSLPLHLTSCGFSNFSAFFLTLSSILLLCLSRRWVSQSINFFMHACFSWLGFLQQAHTTFFSKFEDSCVDFVLHSSWSSYFLPLNCCLSLLLILLPSFAARASTFVIFKEPIWTILSFSWLRGTKIIQWRHLPSSS